MKSRCNAVHEAHSLGAVGLNFAAEAQRDFDFADDGRGEVGRVLVGDEGDPVHDATAWAWASGWGVEARSLSSKGSVTSS